MDFLSHSMMGEQKSSRTVDWGSTVQCVLWEVRSMDLRPVPRFEPPFTCLPTACLRNLSGPQLLMTEICSED
jgi:hypothetical protein